MEIEYGIRKKIESDLGLKIQYVKGQNIPVKNCWHFSTDGSLVDYLFIDDEDFIAGVNRIFILSLKYNIVILAYVLMDTHVHFIIWGEYEESQKFMHEYLKLTSMYLSHKYGTKHKLYKVYPSVQEIQDDAYLKICICYVLKNASAGGLQYNPSDYPWSSSPLYFRREGWWTFCGWNSITVDSTNLSARVLCDVLHTRFAPDKPFRLIGNMVFPEEFVAVDIVEQLFKTHRGFNYFMCVSKSTDVESMRSSVSRLSIPYAELRQHRIDICLERFGTDSIRNMPTDQRLILARILKSRYNSSLKQIAKTCGLIYKEVKKVL